MAEVSNGKAKGVLFVSIFMVTVALLAGMGTVAAQSAPDCSTVTYEGEGTDANPYEISNVDQLQCINERGLDTNYTVVSNIDASITKEWDGGKGFEPIGTPRRENFIGTFDGAGYNINGLYINRQGTLRNTGLFGTVGTSIFSSQPQTPSGTITNVSVVDANITGKSSTGGLVGVNSGTISRSSVSGNITATGDSFVATVGGLVGYNSGVIIKSSASGKVTSDSDRAGGLVGTNFDFYNDGTLVSGAVIKSSASGKVRGNNEVGGLVAENVGTVVNSYATGSVTGSTQVGGLVGLNENGSVKKTYAVGSVTGSDNVGGLIGNNRDTVVDSYWDKEVSGQPYSDGGTGLTTTEMTDSAASSNMAGFNFTNTWRTISDDYPRLAWQMEEDSGLFIEPLPGFNNQPTNTVELDPNLYEDIDGDGDGGDPTQAVTLWTNLVLNSHDFDSLTQQQVDALDWNGDGRLTPADAVQLWTEQVLLR